MKEDQGIVELTVNEKGFFDCYKTEEGDLLLYWPDPVDDDIGDAVIIPKDEVAGWIDWLIDNFEEE